MKNLLFILFLLFLSSCVDTHTNDRRAPNVMVYGPTNPAVEYYKIETNFDIFPYRVNKEEVLRLSLDFDTELTCKAYDKDNNLLKSCFYRYDNKNTFLFEEYQKRTSGILELKFFNDSLNCNH